MVADNETPLIIEPDLDEQEAQRQADRLAEIFAGAFARAAPSIGRDLGNQITAAFSRSTRGGSGFEEQFVAGADGIRRETRRVSDALGDVSNDLRDVGRAATAGIGIGESRVQELKSGLVALAARAEAAKRQLQQVGAEPDLLANVDNILKRVQSSFRQLSQQLDDGFVNENLLRGLEVNLEQANKTVFREVQQTAVLLKNLREQQRTEGNRRNEEASRQAQERLQNARAANARLIVEEQGRNSQLLAETRIAGTRENQARQAAARTRIEIVRFTFRQIQTLERGIAGLFRASGTAAQAAARTTGAALGRIGSLFRRSNRQLNDGLNGALIARERSIDRSFERQTADIRGSLREQSILIDRFERQASTGLVGAATGRSGLGRLFGVGAGIGGGFIIARQLREGFQESVSLTESLNAVRQIAGEAAEEIIRFSENSVEALFLTQSAALEASVGFASFGKSAGLGGQELATFSNTLTQLATDLASFRNTSVEQAIQSLTAALAGEAEPIRRNYSVLLNEATLQQRAFTLGITDTIRKLEPQERVLAAYAEILAQTGDAQGDAARTASDFANAAKEAEAGITQFFAALVGGLKPLGESFLNVFNPALASLTQLIEGGLSERLKIFRDALFGAAAGLAALLVAKAAGEALQFFALGLRAAITPLGLVVVGVAAAGAAIGVFSQRSERFAEILRGVVSGLRSLAGRGLDLAVQGLGALGRILTTTVLPALAQLGQAIAGPVLRGLEIAIGFIVNVAVPAFSQLAMLLVDNIVPALQATGRFITTTVVPALSEFGRVAIGVLSSVVTFLEPAIAGFRTLGEAIVLAFRTGDLSGLLGGLQAVAAGIGQVFAGLGMMIFDALRPQVERAVGFISSAFDNIDFAGIGLRILEVVRLVGFVLGSIVSDPRFIQAIEAVAVAAIAIGVKFVQGFVQGVQSNLPELGRLLGSQLLFLVNEAISFAFSDPATLGRIILAAFAANAILRAWSTAGQRGARSLASGFASGLRAAPVAARDVALGLFGGQASLNDNIARNARIAAERMQREFSRTLRNISRLGGQTADLFPQGIVTQEDIRTAQNRLRELEGSIGQTTASAALFRRRTVEAFAGIRTAISQTSRALVPGLSGSFIAARAGASQALTAISDGFARARAAGQLSGAALGNAVLLGFGSVIAGQQVGGGNTTLGLAGILASAVGALATNGPIVGAAVAGLGLISAGFSLAGQSAEEAARKVDSYVTALEGVSGQKAIIAAAEQITDALAEQDEGVRNLLVRAGFQSEEFIAGALDSVVSLEDVSLQLASALGLSNEALAELERRGGTIAPSADGTLSLVARELRDLELSVGDFIAARDALAAEGSAVQGALAELNFTEAIGVDPERIRRAEEGTEKFRNSIERATAEGVVLGQVSPFVQIADEAKGAAGEVVDFLIGVGFAAEDLVGIDFSDFFDQFETFDLQNFITWFQRGEEALDNFVAKGFTVDAFFDEYQGAGLSVSQINREVAQATQEAAEETDFYADALDALLGIQSSYTEQAREAAESTNLAKAAISELNDQRTTRIRNQVERLRSQLDDAREAADRARDALTSFITARYVNTAQASVDALIGNIGSIGSEIEDALLQGGVRGEAALRSAVGGFESQLAGIIQAGFDQGLRTQDEFRNLLAPLFAALDEEVGDSASRILSTTDFEFGITPRAGTSLRDALNRALAGNQVEVGVQSLINAEAEVDRIEALLNAQQAQLEVEVVFSPEQINAALLAAGATAAQLPDAAEIAAASRTGLEAAVGAAPSVVNGANAGQFPIEVTPPPANVTINVNGAQDPARTTADVVRGQRAATTGRVRVTPNRVTQF